MGLKIFWVFFFVFFFYVVNCDAKSGVPSHRAQKQTQNVQPKQASQSDHWLGLGMGTVIGFGTGQAAQGRWSSAGWPFAVADGLGLAAMLLTFGDCFSCSDQQNHTRDVIRTSGVTLFLASRVIQVGEVLIYGLGHGMIGGNASNQEPPSFSTVVLPLTDGSGAVVAGTLRF